jgi:hypothetical protein
MAPAERRLHIPDLPLNTIHVAGNRMDGAFNYEGHLILFKKEISSCPDHLLYFLESLNSDFLKIVFSR